MQGVREGDTQLYGTGPNGTLQQPTLNGTPWNLAGATGEFWMRRPDRTTIGPRVATITANIPQYADNPSSLNQNGSWEFWFEVTDANGIHKTIGPQVLLVGSAP